MDSINMSWLADYIIVCAFGGIVLNILTDAIIALIRWIRKKRNSHGN